MDLDSATPPNTVSLSLNAHLQSQTGNQNQSRSPSRSHARSYSDAHGGLSPDHRPKKASSTCTTCRLRKVRCDGGRSMCSNCDRLGFPCSYDEAHVDSWASPLPRRRVKRACLSCHSRKARCSGHMPACDRCRIQGISCVYQPSKRSRGAARGSVDERSPHSHDDERHRDRDRDDDHNDSDHDLTDPAGTATPGNHNHHDTHCPDESFDALVGRTFDKFFRHVHHIPMYSFLHRASLMEQYNAGKVDKTLLLALVGITSCLTDMGSGMRDYGDRCIDDAEALLFADYTRPSTFKVQALVFMIKHRILSNKFPSAFVLLSIASRFAAALRLNYDSPNLCFLAQESRRRLMWALYCIDSGISGGYRDFSLWRTDKIYVGLPCNERNFEFDLPQPTEKLVPDSDEPQSPHPEDVGSLALHIRILHIRQKIIEFTKNVLVSRDVDTVYFQTQVMSLQRELDDFANRLPASFQFSESSLRLRAYSPRICVFVMIHVWWRQCHCDLYRLALAGFREALPQSVLDTFDDAFVERCQQQCVEHSLAMADIFSSMQKLNAKPATDLDLAICAYQCARMLKYAYHINAGRFGLTADAVLAQAKVCLQTIKECCMGSAAAGIRSDLEKLISQGLANGATPPQVSSPDANRHSGASIRHSLSRHPLLRNIEVTDEPEVTSAASNTSQPAQLNDPGPTTPLPPPIMSDSWANPFPTNLTRSTLEAQTASNKMEGVDMAPQPDYTPSELNNAYEGALEGLGLDNGLDQAMGLDANMWTPNPDWMGPEFLNGGVGV